ncbi:hypothetical protein GCM10007874_66400 [Labrys miyagiensis]|uniref:Nucleotidyl transferase AbiEii toxin, Type IV TA system n=1 Tax=Labrys miyagiensis TaxID=346912 RepID=A0ABQ6CU27_9HYPH|nr:hypothetical protein [Labrys miyagiensis]GLS23619.1 hypothetical protein GCM10007874_66400 [Labrys miyagiensis]
MSMKETLEVINRMEADGIIGRYAIGGAIAALNYLELGSTEDLDIFVSFDEAVGKFRSGLITLTPILNYLAAKGYREFQKEGILIAGWPVQFLPVADDLEAEGLAEAEEIDMDTPRGKVQTRILRPEHLIANALKVGRAKDILRIAQFLEERAIALPTLVELIQRHSLQKEWKTFCLRAGIIDPLGL